MLRHFPARCTGSGLNLAPEATQFALMKRTIVILLALTTIVFATGAALSPTPLGVCNVMPWLPLCR